MQYTLTSADDTGRIKETGTWDRDCTLARIKAKRDSGRDHGRTYQVRDTSDTIIAQYRHGEEIA